MISPPTSELVATASPEGNARAPALEGDVVEVPDLLRRWREEHCPELERRDRRQLEGREIVEAPPARAPSGSQGMSRPRSAASVFGDLSKGGNSAALVHNLQQNAKRDRGGPPPASRSRDAPTPARSPSGSLTSTLAGLLGGDRSPDERAENERRRAESLRRARREAERLDAGDVEREPIAPDAGDDRQGGEDDGSSE